MKRVHNQLNLLSPWKHKISMKRIIKKNSYQQCKYRFQEGSGKKEGIAGNCNPNDTFHLTLRRDLINISQCFQYGTKSMREDGDFTDTYHADDGQGDGIDEYHPLARILWGANHLPFGLFPIDDHEERSESSHDDDFSDIWQRVRQNDRDTTEVDENGDGVRIQNMTDEEWEEHIIDEPLGH